MKVNRERVALRNVKFALVRLGIAKEDINGVLNYIKFLNSNVVDTTAKPKTTAKRGRPSASRSTEETVLSVLNKDINKPHSIQDIADKTGFKYAKVQASLKKLKASRKIKIVDYEAGSSGPSKLLYQIYKSPLKALKTVTEKQGYSTISGFIKSHQKLIGKSGVLPFYKTVEQANLSTYPLALKIGIAKGYRNTDLKKLITEGSSTKKTSKVSSKPKRKYTRKVKAEAVSITPEITKDKSVGIFSIFKRKRNTSELIKF